PCEVAVWRRVARREAVSSCIGYHLEHPLGHPAAAAQLAEREVRTMQLLTRRKRSLLRDTRQPRPRAVTRIPFAGTIAELGARLVNTAAGTGRQVVASNSGWFRLRKA